MQIYILYHENCPDGFGAAFAAWIKFGSLAKYIPVNYGKPPPDMEALSDVYIVDFSYPAQTLVELGLKHRQVFVLDHHASAKRDLTVESIASCSPKNWVTHSIHPLWIHSSADGVQVRLSIQFDMSRSGAVLAWEYFHETPPPMFFRYLEDRDLWKFELPESREVSMAVRSFPMDFNTWMSISGIVPTSLDRIPGTEQVHLDVSRAIDRLKTEGRACRRLTEQMVDTMVKNKRNVLLDMKHKGITFDGDLNPEYGAAHKDNLLWYVPVANATVFFSEVGERLCQLCPDAPFSAYYFDRSDGVRQWGLRSRVGFDCSVVAKAFGGGGHPGAAGFSERL